MIGDLFIAASINLPFPLAWKRVRCIKKNHRSQDYEVIDKMRSEVHPSTDAEYIYTVNILLCKHCGLTYLDPGLEFRDRSWIERSE